MTCTRGNQDIKKYNTNAFKKYGKNLVVFLHNILHLKKTNFYHIFTTTIGICTTIIINKYLPSLIEVRITKSKHNTTLIILRY